MASIDNHPTLFELLEFENNDFVVGNALCDYMRVEKILLFENNNEATDVLVTDK